MYKIIKSENFRNQVNDFTERFLSKYIDLFSDTGIENEILIQNNYIEASSNLHRDILTKVDEIFSSEILPKRVWESGKLSCVVFVGNFRLFIDYTEDKEEQIRYIENIKFSRK